MKTILLIILSFLILNKAKSQYCVANATTCDEYISRVQVGSIDNSSNCTSGGYADYTSLSTNMNIGTGYPITVTNILYFG